MKIVQTPFQGLVEIYPTMLVDHRGFFYESYNQEKFAAQGYHWKFVQDNQSYSYKGVLRGLHFQKPPHAQGKLIRVIKGSVLDVVVDLRKDQPTFGKHISFMLNQQQGNMVYVPEGFAHGFITLEDTFLHYKCTHPYHKDSEWGLLWNDPALGIDWKVDQPILSEKDVLLPTFEKYCQLLNAF